jgi:hypothetical protein
LGSSVVNAVIGKDTKLLSEDLKDSIGRLVEYVFFLRYFIKHLSELLSTEEYRKLWRLQTRKSQRVLQHTCWQKMTLRFSKVQTRDLMNSSNIFRYVSNSVMIV